MGHYCRICGRVRANERFSGRGHRDHICKDCQRMPHEKRQRIEQLDELYGFLDQSNISNRNIERLATLTQATHQEVPELASLLLEIARVHPRKRRRLKFLARQRRDLLKRLKAALGQDWFEDLLCDLDFDQRSELIETETADLSPDCQSVGDARARADSDPDEIPF
jgi:hypothetical protein